MTDHNEETTTTAVAVISDDTVLDVISEDETPFPVLARTPSQLLSEIEEALGGEELSGMSLESISLPAGGGTTYTIPGLEGEEEVTEFDAIIIAAQNSRAYWANAYTGEITQPDCSSPDGRLGVGLYQYGSPENPTGVCAACPMSQFQNGQRPACKLSMNVYLLLKGQMFPVRMRLPISSIGAAKNPEATTWKGYHRLLLNYRKSAHQVVTTIGIRHGSFGGTGGKSKGTPYAIATFKISDTQLTAAEAKRAKAYALALQPYLLMPSPVITNEAGEEIDVETLTGKKQAF